MTFLLTPIILLLTIAERLRRKDREVAKGLQEKHQLAMDILHMPLSSSSSAAPPAEEQPTTAEEEEPSPATAALSAAIMSEKDAKDILLAALVQGTYNIVHKA